MTNERWQKTVKILVDQGAMKQIDRCIDRVSPTSS